MVSEKTKRAVLLLAFGGPESMESVEPFVKNVLKGRPVGEEILNKAKERYRLIGGKSPLLDITNAQARALEERLRKNGFDYKVYVGMRYWDPFIRETVRKMNGDGVQEAAAIVMSPFSTIVATGGYEKEVDEARKELGGGPRMEYLADWHINPAFLDIIIERLKAELKAFKDPAECLVIFSNHSLPLMAIEGDPYEMKIRQTVDEITRRLPVDHRIAFQSAGSGPREWLGPRTEDVIPEARAMGKKGVIVVPLGFVADHVETLYDIDILFKDIAAKNGLAFRRTPSINTDEKFTGLIAGIVKKQYQWKR